MKWVRIFQVGIFWLGIFWEGIVPGGIFLEPFAICLSWFYDICPREKLLPNPKTNPNPNPDPNREQFPL